MEANKLFGKRKNREEPIPEEPIPVVEEKEREIPNNADFVVLYNCGQWIGYTFLLEPLISINKWTVMGKKDDGKKFVMIGGTYVQRPISSIDMTVEEVLGGIYHTHDFRSSVDEYPSCSSVRAIAYGSLGNRNFRLELRKFIEVTSDENKVVMIDKDNRRIIMGGKDLQLYCYEINNGDDHDDDEDEPDPFDLKTLGAPKEVSPNT